MPDMYDKLGDLLNEALESGKINNESSAQAENIQDRDTSSENCDKSGLFYFNQSNNRKTKTKKKSVKIPENELNQTAEVIKMHKYTENMHIPPHIQKAVTTLDIVYPYTTDNIKLKYREYLKRYHPDSKNTIQDNDTVHFNRQLSIDEIKEAYTLLIDYFTLK